MAVTETLRAPKTKFNIMKKIFKTSLKVFRIILLTFSVILVLFSSIAVILTILNVIQPEIALLKKGFIDFIGLLEPFKTLLAATFITIPIYIALETLISGINNQEGKALIDIRKLLSEPENLEIHKKLRGTTGDWAIRIPEEEKNDKDTWRKIDNYLGILELINILIDKDVISKRNFENQFGYRVKNVLSNLDIMEYLEDYRGEETTWRELFSLFDKVKI